VPAGNLTTPTFALLAFLVAFYALLARERKTPYITTFIYRIAILLTVTILLESLDHLVEVQLPAWRSDLNWCAFGLLTVSVISVIHNIWRLHNRHVHFRDDHLIRNLTIVRWVKHKYRALKGTPSYEHTPEGLRVEDVLESLAEDIPMASEVHRGVAAAGIKSMSNSISIAICRRRLIETDALLLGLIKRLLDRNWYVQYATCIRHPYELIEKLTATVKDQAATTRIAVVDAYTPHFGFTDSIHQANTAKILKLGVQLVTSHSSYAGVHTATAKAFNKIKIRAGEKVRPPTLVIYEGFNALVDLESPEQYRIFVRHVLPSERAWGGMLTLFIEPTVPASDSSLLDTYSDAFVGQLPESAGGSGNLENPGA
jgi:hypothetical protein